MKRCVWLFTKAIPGDLYFLHFSHRCDNDAIADDPQLCAEHWPSKKPFPPHES